MLLCRLEEWGIIRIITKLKLKIFPSSYSEKFPRQSLTVTIKIINHDGTRRCRKAGVLSAPSSWSEVTVSPGPVVAGTVARWHHCYTRHMATPHATTGGNLSNVLQLTTLSAARPWVHHHRCLCYNWLSTAQAPEQLSRPHPPCYTWWIAAVRILPRNTSLICT